MLFVQPANRVLIVLAGGECLDCSFRRVIALEF
jgi:hypothetical protein